MPHPKFDLQHLLIDLHGQMHSCIRKFSFRLDGWTCLRMGIILVCGDYYTLYLYLMFRMVCTKSKSFILWSTTSRVMLFARPTAKYIYTWVIVSLPTDLPHYLRCHTSSLWHVAVGNIMSRYRMYRMIRHIMHRQQTPPRQKVSQDICRAHHPIFFFEKKIMQPWSLSSHWKVLQPQ